MVPFGLLVPPIPGDATLGRVDLAGHQSILRAQHDQFVDGGTEPDDHIDLLTRLHALAERSSEPLPFGGRPSSAGKAPRIEQQPKEALMLIGL
jgi:hypothetical protein